jgi:hypothetical protein
MGRLRSWFRQMGPEAPRREPVKPAERRQPSASARPRKRSFNEAAHKRGR